jgi:cbb3-type cytochrome oxidase subunit 3
MAAMSIFFIVIIAHALPQRHRPQAHRLARGVICQERPVTLCPHD